MAIHADITPGTARPLGALLLVEDAPDNLQLETLVLRAYGFHVDACSTAREALLLLGRQTYDGLVLDLKLPDMDGLELARRVRGLDGHQNVPIVAVTGRGMPGDEAKALAAGCCAYIVKPVNTRTLARQVADALNPSAVVSKA
ncbi:MAG: response regulator [Armatimonadia bacterium]